MITYLPVPNFYGTAIHLDDMALDKQRTDALLILKILLSEHDSELSSHPAVKMWRGYESALASYGIEMCVEWKNRGFSGGIYYRIIHLVNTYGLSLAEFEYPPWFGKDEVHKSHRSRLIRKAGSDLVKANYAYEHRERMGMGHLEKSLKAKLDECEKVYKWYDRFDWPDDHAKLVWPVD